MTCAITIHHKATAAASLKCPSDWLRSAEEEEEEGKKKKRPGFLLMIVVGAY